MSVNASGTPYVSLIKKGLWVASVLISTSGDNSAGTINLTPTFTRGDWNDKEAYWFIKRFRFASTNALTDKWELRYSVGYNPIQPGFLLSGDHWAGATSENGLAGGSAAFVSNISPSKMIALGRVESATPILAVISPNTNLAGYEFMIWLQITEDVNQAIEWMN